AEIARRAGLWLHVDAAYGGFFLLTEEGREKLAGIDRADTLVMDPHKTLFLPYGTGALLVRDGDRLRRAMSGGADYLQDTLAAGEEVSPADLSPELTRHFRGLRMWLPLKVLGLAPFRAALEEKLLLARYFHQRMVESARFEAGPPPDLSVVTFRLNGGDEANRALLEAIHGDGRIFLSSTRLDGRFTLRMAAVCHRTHKAEVDTMIDVLHELAGRA
ncbi:MAG: pyridoxal-dependent decarboxylase, partial [Wenzhouxiangellaceae bacterium]|nr:pyridoxal-dependent decarboxylase [Wenzhouxiangellaceae bacterium]